MWGVSPSARIRYSVALIPLVASYVPFPVPSGTVSGGRLYYNTHKEKQSPASYFLFFDSLICSNLNAHSHKHYNVVTHIHTHISPRETIIIAGMN